MENAQRVFSEEGTIEGNKVFPVSLNAKTKKSKYWELPIMANHGIVYLGDLSINALANKSRGQGCGINLGIPFDPKNYPDGETVFSAFKSCPFARVSSIPKRTTYFGESVETWKNWANPPKYAFQLDSDDCTEEERDKILAFAEWIGANGAVWREKKPGVWSVNVAFHLSDYMLKEYAKPLIRDVIALCKQEFGVSPDDAKGSENDCIKNIWAIRTLVEMKSMGLKFSPVRWTVKGPRGGCHGSYLSWKVEEGELGVNDVLNSGYVIWNERTIGSWTDLRRKVEDVLVYGEREEEKSVESKASSLEREKQDIAENLTPSPKVYNPPVTSGKKTPMDYFPNWKTSRHDYISLFWKDELVESVKVNGELKEEEYWRIYRKYEAKASKVTGKPLLSKDDNWGERNLKVLKKKPLSWWTEKCPKATYGTYKRIAGKLLRSAMFAIEKGIEGGLKTVAELILNGCGVKDSMYIQAVLRKSVSSSRTKAEYRKLAREKDLWIMKASEVLAGVKEDEMTKGESLLFELLEKIKNELEEGEEKSVESKAPSFQSIEERIKALKTQEGKSKNYNRDLPKRSMEDERWLHVEKVDNFDHLNTDMENRMMGREYIRDAEKYHTEGLYSLRDEAVQMARSYGYIGDFSWEDSKSTGIDWEGIHGKVFKAEEEKENKPQKSPVSFADIRARLMRMG